MNFLDIARTIFGLVFVLGLIGLAAWAARRYAPQILARLSAERGERRMQVVETLVLDPARRMILIRIDGEERLLLLGEGRELIEPRGQDLTQPPPASVSTPARPASPLAAALAAKLSGAKQGGLR